MTIDNSDDDNLPPQRPARSRAQRPLPQAQAAAPAAKPAPSGQPHKWWQWLLVYPSIAVALVSAVPTAYQAYISYRAKVPFHLAFDAEEQANLWVKNEECTRSAQYTTIVTSHHVEIGSLVCKSGDVQLRAKRPEWDNPQIRWVAWSSIAALKDSERTKTGLSTLISSAHAQEFSPTRPSQQGAPRVICQRWVGNGLLLQRVATPNGCFDQVVNTFNGWVVSSNPVACNPSC